jgi:predicted ATPase
MDEVRWRRVSALFVAALEGDPAERATLLAASVDPDLRREVESLLAAHEATGPLDRLAGQMDVLRKDALSRSPRSPRLGSGGDERPPSLEPGQCLGRHEIRGRLGAGGMGEVYRAYDTRLQREVAIKVLGRGVLERPGARLRFEQEARAASALNHPNIITVYDIGEEASCPYIVMEVVEGSSLRQMLGGPWPVDLMLHLSVQIADGLVAAHERQIIHLDLKPENILVNRQGAAKILDFGLAQFRRHDEEPVGAERTPGPLLGTLGYLPPETLADEPADSRADQFSFGAILYEMAAGARAFPGRTSLETLAMTLGDGPRPLSEVRPDLPPRLAQAITRCLRKEPTERFPSTRILLDEIRAVRRAPPPGARPEPAPRRVALPAQRTRLIGRERELEEIQRLIVEKEVRLLTLTGPGGTGKTRLGLRAAEMLSPHFVGGVFFVPLSPINDAALVAPTIAAMLGGLAGVPRSSLAGVIADLQSANAPTLVVLDNFEQVIDAAPTVSDLLAACPDLTIILTSREVLRLYGEHGFPVSTLELPDPARLPPLDVLAQYPALALFVERARAVNPAFGLTAENAAAVAALCAGLDGLPLALELAAAQARILSPEAMLSRFEHRLGLLTEGPRDLPSRQQTLRRTIDWSHQLLEAREQAVFRRLGVFAGGFTLEAAQAVSDPYGTLGLATDQAVRALVDKSLLEVRESAEGEPRFSMLETLREYALEKLVESGEEDRSRRAHAAYFLVLAEEGFVSLASSGPPHWLKRFETEHDNFRVALEWLTQQGNADWGLRMALGLFPFWERGEHLAEGRRRLGSLLDLEEGWAVPGRRANAVFAAAVLAHIQGDVEKGIELHAQSLQIYRELGDERGVVVALVALGTQYVAVSQYEKAESVLQESLEAWQRLGDQAGFARSLSNLGYVARVQGRLHEARARYVEAAAIFAELGDRLSHAWAINHEGDAAREQGRPDAAASLYERALATFRALENDWGIGTSLADLGAIARQRGDYAAAGRLYREALHSFVRLDHRRGIARLLESLACLAAEEGRAEHGLLLAAAASVLRDRVGAPPSPAVQSELQRSLGAMRQALGLEAARRVWREGVAMPVEGVIRLATGGRA